MPRPATLAAAAAAVLLLAACARAPVAGDPAATAADPLVTAAVRQQPGDGSGRITATDGVNLAWITVPQSASDAEASAFLGVVIRAAG